MQPVVVSSGAKVHEIGQLSNSAGRIGAKQACPPVLLLLFLRIVSGTNDSLYRIVGKTSHGAGKTDSSFYMPVPCTVHFHLPQLTFGLF